MEKIKVFDVGSTDQGAYRLLKTRVKKIDSDERFDNYIVCPSGEWQKRMLDEGVKCINFDVTRGLGIKSVFLETKKLRDIFIEHRPDIVHSHNSKTGALARIAVYSANKKLDKKIKMIHQVHGYHFTTYTGIKKEIFLLIEKLLSNITDVLLFQNKYEFELSKDNKMDKKSELVYIGNGINVEEFQDIEVKKTETKGTNIVCVARIEPVKNHMMLLESIKVLKDKYGVKDFTLTLIGEGDRTELEKFINENNLSSNVVFTGILDRKDVINTIYNSDISVLTSIKEGKPRALIESMLLGKPCVGTNVVGTNEVIKDRENGYLVELNDFEGFADKLYSLIIDNELCNKFSKNAKEFAYNNFNEDVVINKIISSYLD
ncbi:glycosyltransferase [Clostridium sp.]|uniref:glycosyltransferase n=1 Tax=Clostridium sp. TaxID=1506 RepID=UPI001B58FFD5|nr:glycosyltransferase [Clostridium sp.]MBP3917182.1 glycosyltransferase [Clostridium sp.]